MTTGLLNRLNIITYPFILIPIFFTTYIYLFGMWESEDYTYCYLIAPIALYLIWEKRVELAKIPSTNSWFGIGLILSGIAFFWLGELGGEFTILFISSWLILVGIIIVHFGWPKLKCIWFPILFLLAMFPPPSFIHNRLTLKLKILSSQIGVAMMQAYGMSAYREGNIIDLGFTQLQVVDACSGLRFLFPLMIMGILFAYLFRSAWWEKIFLVISTIPLTIVTNSLRIAMTGILFELWGPKVAKGFFHGFSGWFIFMFGLVVLLVEMWLLKKIFPKKKNTSIQSPVPQVKDLDSNTTPSIMPPSPKIFLTFFRPPQFIVAIVLLGSNPGVGSRR